MNGKKAKSLRGLAGKGQVTQYVLMKGTSRNKFMNTSPKLNPDGTVMLDVKGQPVFNRIEWTTATIMMAAGARQINKVLKNIYKNRTRDLHVNIHTNLEAA